MTYEEFVAWGEFYELWPFDDLHRFHRPAALIAAVKPGSLKGLEEFVEFLSPEPDNAGMTDADMVTMRAMGFRRKGG